MHKTEIAMAKKALETQDENFTVQDFLNEYRNFLQQQGSKDDLDRLQNAIEKLEASRNSGGTLTNIQQLKKAWADIKSLQDFKNGSDGKQETPNKTKRKIKRLLNIDKILKKALDKGKAANPKEQPAVDKLSMRSASDAVKSITPPDTTKKFVSTVNHQASHKSFGKK